MAKARRWCKDCASHVLAESAAPDKQWLAANGCLTLVTLGLWLPVAVVWAAVKTNALLCPKCGRWCGNRWV